MYALHTPHTKDPELLFPARVILLSGKKIIEILSTYVLDSDSKINIFYGPDHLELTILKSTGKISLELVDSENS